MTQQLALDFTAAKTRGDLGAERAAHRAERTEPGWINRAAEAVRDVVKFAGFVVGDQFTIEQVRACVGCALSEPPDARAWGHVTRRAVQLGYIEPTGGYAPAASSNGSPKRLYRRGKNA